MQNCCRWILWQWPKLLSEVERSLRPCSQWHELSFWNEKRHDFLVRWWQNVMNLPQFVEFETSSLPKRGVLKMRNLYLDVHLVLFSWHEWIQETFFFKAELKLTQIFGEFSSKNLHLHMGYPLDLPIFFWGPEVLHVWPWRFSLLGKRNWGRSWSAWIYMDLESSISFRLIFIGRLFLFLF